jgi:hypothetical protein
MYLCEKLQMRWNELNKLKSICQNVIWWSPKMCKVADHIVNGQILEANAIIEVNKSINRKYVIKAQRNQLELKSLSIEIIVSKRSEISHQS